MLVLPSVIPRPELAVNEMRRVTRPRRGRLCGVLGFPGGAAANRMFWDTAAALDESSAEARDRTMSRLIYAPGALPRIWAEAGLTEIDQRSLTIRMDFADFADYWEPFASGEGMLGEYVASLDATRRDPSWATVCLPDRKAGRPALLRRRRAVVPRRRTALTDDLTQRHLLDTSRRSAPASNIRSPSDSACIGGEAKSIWTLDQASVAVGKEAIMPGDGVGIGGFDAIELTKAATSMNRVERGR